MQIFQKTYNRLFVLVFFCSQISACDTFAQLGMYDIAGAYENRKGNYEEAVKYYSRALKWLPKEKENKREEHKKWYNERGKAYIHMGQFYRSIADFNEAISLNPKDAEAYINRGVAFYYLNSFDTAEKSIKQSIQISPNGYTNVPWLFLSSKRMGRKEDTDLKEWTKTYNPASNESTPVPITALNLEKIYPPIGFVSGNENPEEEIYRCISYFHMGQYYLLRNEREKARELFQKAFSTYGYRAVEHAAAKVELDRLQQ